MTHLILLIALIAKGDIYELVSYAGTGKPGYSGDGGPAEKATLNNPFDVAFDGSGNLYLSDTMNHCIRKVESKTSVITTVAGTGKPGFSGDDGLATKGDLNEPYGIVIDKPGNVYFADRLNRRVRRVDAKTGLISTVAGTGAKVSSGDGGPASQAGLIEPNGVALDREERNLLIADVAAHRIRNVDLGTGRISTFAGTGEPRHSGDDGPAAKASIHGARAVDIGPDGTVYILEREGNTLRAIDPKGTIRLFAGTGAKGFTGDGGPAMKATFNGPKELAVDANGNVFVVDTENHAIRRIDGKTGIISTPAGDGKKARAGEMSTRLARPHGVAIGPDGAIVIGDTENHRIAAIGG